MALQKDDTYMSNSSSIDQSILERQLQEQHYYDHISNTDEYNTKMAELKEKQAITNTTQNINKSEANKYDPYYRFDESEGNRYNAASSISGGPTTGGGLAELDARRNPDLHAMQTNSLHGIFGIPYQFMDTVDRRIVPGRSDSLGRKYAEKIMSHAPLLMLTPCRQKFMEGFNANDKDKVLASLIKEDANYLKNNIDGKGRYYTTQFAYYDYYTAVRLMCKEVSHFLGIDNISVDYGGQRCKIGDIDWYHCKNEAFSRYFAAKNSVVLYVDGLVDLSDSFTNNTTESSIASSLNQYGEQARELRFLASDSALEGLYEGSRDILSTVGSGIGNVFEKLTGSMIGDLAGTGVNTILNGGKIIFPKIWGDSNSSRSYSFQIKLRSPDHDTVSIFFNVLVPYIHLLALCLPQSITDKDFNENPNAYDTPFLVRAYCKGMFNINMGMITDLSATRGAESQWNNQGLPTQIDVSISIEDLYSNLVMSNPTKNGFDKVWKQHIDIVTNTEMLDFLCNLSGLNIAAETNWRRVELFYQLGVTRVKWVPSQIYNYFENGVTNFLRRFWYDRRT